MRCFVLFLFFLYVSGCAEKKPDLENRIQQYRNELGITEDKFLLISLDDCSSCSSFFKSRALDFLKYEGAVVVVSKNTKKARGFLDIDLENVHHDPDHLSKALNLEQGLPVVYQINEGKIDSVIFR